MSKSRLLIVASLLVLASGAALAQDAPKYSYIEAGYIDFDPDGGLSDDGMFGGVSVGILKNFHLMAEYDEIGDFSFWNAGFGWHGLLGDPADLFAEAVWNDVSYDSGTEDFSDDGYEVAAGVRWKVIKWLELKGKVAWADYSEAGDDMGYSAEAVFSFLNDRLGVGASWETYDSDDTLRGFVRFNFGK